MKKLFAIVLAVLMVVTCFAACSSDEAAGAKKNDEPKALTAKDVLSKSTKAMRDANSFGYDGSMETGFSIDAGGMKMSFDMNMDLGGEMSYDNLLMHMIMNVDFMNEKATTEMYMDMNSPITTYTSNDGEYWFKETMDDEISAQLSQFLEKGMELETSEEYVDCYENLAMTEKDGAYEITGTINTEKFFELTGYSVEDLMAEMNENVSEEEKALAEEFITSLFDSLNGIEFTMGVAKDTFYPTYMKSDMTEPMNNVISDIIKLAMEVSEDDSMEGTEFTVTNCVVELNYKDMGTTKVVIPDEVLAAEDLWYDEYIYEDYEQEVGAMPACDICGEPNGFEYDFDGEILYICNDCMFEEEAL